MATGWAGDGAVQDQIDATVKDGISRAKARLPSGPSLTHCEECGAKIPDARQQAVAMTGARHAAERSGALWGQVPSGA